MLRPQWRLKNPGGLPDPSPALKLEPLGNGGSGSGWKYRGSSGCNPWSKAIESAEGVGPPTVLDSHPRIIIGGAGVPSVEVVETPSIARVQYEIVTGVSLYRVTAPSLGGATRSRPKSRSSRWSHKTPERGWRSLGSTRGRRIRPTR